MPYTIDPNDTRLRTPSLKELLKPLRKLLKKIKKLKARGNDVRIRMARVARKA